MDLNSVNKMDHYSNPEYPPKGNPPADSPPAACPPEGRSKDSVPNVEVIEEGRHHQHYKTGYNPSLKQEFVPPPQKDSQPGLPGVLNPPPCKEEHHNHHNKY